MLCVWLSKDWSIQENNNWNVWWKVGTLIGFIVVQNNGWAEQNQAAIQMSTYTGDNPNKDILTCVTSVSCVAIVAMTNVAGHVVFTSTIYTRGWCTMIYNCEIMYKIQGLVWVSCGLYKQKLIDM